VLDKLQAAPKGMGKVGLTAEGKQVPYQQVEGLGLGGIKTNIDVTIYFVRQLYYCYR